MSNDMSMVRQYIGELIRACFEKRKPSAIPEGVTIDQLINYAYKGQMLYLMLSPLIKLGLEKEDAVKINSLLRGSSFRTFRQVGEAKAITNALENAGVRHQLLKGAVLKMDYPRPEMREMNDIDLVLYDDDIDKVSRIFEELHFENQGLLKHHTIFSKGKDMEVEVHHSLYDKNVDHDQYMYFNDFRAKRKEGTGYTYEFSHEDFYVYMLAHMAKHFFETGCGIRNLLDIYVYRKKYGEVMNWPYTYRELDKCGIKDFEAHMTELAFMWLEDKTFTEFYENLFAYMLDSGIYGKGENGVWGQLAKESREIGSVKMHYYFPTYDSMVEKYTWLRKAPVLLPAAWIIRGINGLFSKQSRNNYTNLLATDDADTNRMLEIYHKLNLDFRK